MKTYLATLTLPNQPPRNIEVRATCAVMAAHQILDTEEFRTPDGKIPKGTTLKVREK